MTALAVADPADRDDLGAFTARVVRLDPTATVRLRGEDRDGTTYVTAWAPTPFDALATRSVPGQVDPTDVTVAASGLLTALAVDRAAVVDPGPAVPVLLADLPPADGWAVVDDVPAAELDALAERGLVMARENAGPLGPPASLLDQAVLTVQGAGPAVKVPLRCLFALSGMGFLGSGPQAAPGGDTVRVSATGSWLRLDARFGAVVRRRVTALPLIVA
ncbi:MAG: hypothetical protein ACT4RN_15745 [Pseudonocardia sp.]